LTSDEQLQGYKTIESVIHLLSKAGGEPTSTLGRYVKAFHVPVAKENPFLHHSIISNTLENVEALFVTLEDLFAGDFVHSCSSNYRHALCSKQKLKAYLEDIEEDAQSLVKLPSYS